MSNLFLRFRGLAIALAVLALSATVALAAAPAAHVASTTPPTADKHVESPEASESAEPSESPEASETPDADGAEAAAGTASEDTHGALVSAAAQMETPEGFANHGAFVSCVAHLDVTLAAVDWTTVTPASCAAVGKGTDKAAEKSAAGKAKGAAGRAQGAAARAAHQPSR